MPFSSRKQMRWMFANEPEMAERWAKETPDMKHLPEKADSYGRQSRKPQPKRKHKRYGE